MISKRTYENVFVSIVIPTFNTPYKYLEQSVKSILCQTHKNFELIIVDDGSSEPISLNAFNDSRIILVRNTNNMGLVYSLNKGMSLCNGKYVFRMDADDVAFSIRLEYCINLLEQDTEIDILAGNAIEFGNSSKRTKMPKSNEMIRASLLLYNPIVHPTVVFRKSSLEKFEIRYDNSYAGEDYSLWCKLVPQKNIRFFNSRKYLIKYRVHPGQITSSQVEKLEESSLELKKLLVSYLLLNITEEELSVYGKFCSNLYRIDYRDYKTILLPLISKIIVKNKSICVFDQKAIKKVFKTRILKQVIIQVIIYKNFNFIKSIYNYAFFKLG